MIRDRRDEDLDRLCAVVEALAPSPASRHGVAARAWLEELDAEVSWVFDGAPVRVTPTRNVVGHVQVHRPVTGQLPPGPVGPDQRPPADVRVVGRLFVRPDRHAEAVGRFLLREAVRHVVAGGHLALVDLRDTGFSRTFFVRHGFSELRLGEPEDPLLIHSG